MAEFAQQETQEQKTFKSKISPFARKLAPVEPIDTTAAKGHEIEMWNQVSNGVAVGGMLIERARVIADKIKGNKIMFFDGYDLMVSGLASQLYFGLPL